MKKAFLLLFLLFFGLSTVHSSLLWHYSTGGSTTAKPVIYQGAVVVASDDGNIYAFDPVSSLPTGAKRWQTVVGKRPNELVLADNSIYLSTTSGRIFKLGANGAIQWQMNLTTTYNVTFIYGLGINQKYLFVTANNGVYVVGKDGKVKSKIASFGDSVVTPPTAGSDYVVYGREKELVKLSETGQVQWKTSLDEGAFWLSKPVVDGNTIYIGALDSKMHAYLLNNGLEVWQVKTHNWVVSTPLVKDGNVYFGSNDGGIYSISASEGSLVWFASTPLAVQSQPELGLMGGQPVVFVGGTDKSVYAASVDNGEILWKGYSAGAAGSPVFYQNKVIFGSEDGNVYAYSTERACSIANPHEADMIGLKEVVVRGNYVSESGNARVLIQINDGEWQEANTSAVTWTYYINPAESLRLGLNTISCQVADDTGSELGTTFTTVTINHDSSAPLGDLVVTVSPTIVEGRQFTVYVNDDVDNSPIERFLLTINGKTYTGDRNVTLVIPQAGTYTTTVKKMGFRDATMNITVNPSGVNPLHVGIGVLLIVVIVWQVWKRFLSQKFGKRK